MKLISKDQADDITNSARQTLALSLAERLRVEAATFGDAGERNKHYQHQRSKMLLSHLKTLFADLGITRLSRITGLDTIGIPVWAAIRPNARTLSVSQGKGLTDDHAAISAVMECFELAVCECRHPYAFLSTEEELKADQASIIAVHRYLRRGSSMPASKQRQTWVEGLDLLNGTPTFVPEEIVRLDDEPGSGSTHPYWQTSDGYGAGPTLTEAILHGLCECVERDALALASLRTPKEIQMSEVVPASLGSMDLKWAGDRIANAGLSLRLYDITSNLSIPSFLALVAPSAINRLKLKYTDLASGTGTHPNAGRAAVRAVTEAVQTRLTTIAGARDDFEPEHYRRDLPRDLEIYLRLPNSSDAVTSERHYPNALRHPAGDLEWSLSRLREAGLTSATAVSFETEQTYGVSMVRVLVPELEGDPGSKNVRPGRRALAAMLGAR